MTQAVDLLIVGSGAVGSVFARQVHQLLPGHRILVVDIGPRLTDRAGMNLKNLDPRHRSDALGRLSIASRPAHDEGGAADDAQTIARGTAALARPGTHLLDPPSAGFPGGAMSSNVGGMTAHWTCAIPRPDSAERVPFISSADHHRYLTAAEWILRMNARAFSHERNDRLLQALGSVFDDHLPHGRKVQPMPLACEVGVDGRLTWTGADTILGPLAKDDGPKAGVEIRPGTICLQLHGEGGQIRSALLKDVQTGEVETLDVHAVAVAADSLRTPQLLWASGIRMPALGRYFNDQPQVLSAVRVRDTFVRGPHDEQAKGDRGGPQGVLWVPYSEPGHPFHGQVMNFDLSPVQPAGVSPVAEPVVALSWFCPKTPRARDRVEFSADRVDGFGMPEIRVVHNLTDADHENIALATKHQVAAAAAIGDFIAGQQPQALPAGSSLHYQGTVRMGARDDGTSVCNEYSRVWGYGNLYVGGNGVIPTATACNPTLTSVALALRASEDIVTTLS